MLFMMLIGAPPFPMASPTNPAFKFVVNGRLRDVLKHWKRLRLVNEEALDLLNKIFVYESKRITMDEILKHPFVNLADANKKKTEVQQTQKQATKTDAAESSEKTPLKQKEQQQSTPQPNAKAKSPNNEKEAPPVATKQPSVVENKEIEDIRTHTFKSEMAQSFADRLKVDSLPLEQLKAIMEDVEMAHSPLNKQPKNTSGDSSFAEIKCEIEAIYRYLEKQMAAQQSSTQQNKHKAEQRLKAVQ